MRLYRLTTHFYGKDLNKPAILGYVVAADDGRVYDHINRTFQYGDWPDAVNLSREEIIDAQGDHDTDYMGEFYDQKFGWDDLGDVTEEDTVTLKRLQIV